MGRRQACTPPGSPCWLCRTVVISGRGRRNETRRFDNDTLVGSYVVLYVRMEMLNTAPVYKRFHSHAGLRMTFLDYFTLALNKTNYAI